MHVHVHCSHGEAKFWLEPNTELAENYGLRGGEITTALSGLRNMKMKSETHGVGTSEAEVTHISKHGFWLLLEDGESFLPFEKFPWFREATVSAILNVKVLSEHHLYWPDLDVDLAVDSIEHPERFPLIAKESPA